jgi:hypothetical protein
MKKILLLSLAFLLVFPNSVDALSQEEIDNFGIQIKVITNEIVNLQETIYSIIYSQGGGVITLSQSEVKETIDKGVSWLQEAQEESGHFQYEYLPYEDKYLNTDNIVRQSGAFFILGEVAVQDSSKDLKDNLVKAISYFESISSYGSYNGKNFRCVSQANICDLGTTALVVIGILDTLERYPELDYRFLLEDYSNYLLAMKMEGKGFRSEFVVTGNSQSDEESSYFNGEGLLALVRYYSYKENRETKEVIDDMFSYLKDSFDIPLYLWMTAAVRDIYNLWPEQKYVDYLKSYTDWRINGFKKNFKSKHNMCSYIEGVISAYSVFKSKVSNPGYYEREIDFWLNKSKELQITDDDVYRFGENGVIKINNLQKAQGGFLTGRNELTQRIDFTQHCISSYLQRSNLY